MGIISEAATEATIRVIVTHIKKMLEEKKDKPDAVDALKELGLFVLTKSDWYPPPWAQDFEQLFRE